MSIFASGNPLVVGLSVAAVTALSLVKFFRTYGSFIRVRSRIRGLPGPARPSGLAGFATGHLGVILHRDALSWHHEVVKKFGNSGNGAGVVQFNGLFGV